jgi:prefoldin subunit 5
MEIKKHAKKLYTTLGVIVTVGAVFAAVWAFDDRYTNEPDHTRDVATLKEKTKQGLDALEQDVAMVLKDFQQEMQKQAKRNDYRYYTEMLADINFQIRKMVVYVNEHPTEQWAKDELKYLETRRDAVQKKLNELME